MSDKTAVAVQSMKAAQAEITQWENRLEYLKGQHQTLTNAKETLSAEIEQKKADYEIYLASRDAETKKQRNDVLTQREELENQKKEIQAIIAQVKIDKDNVGEQRRIVEIDKLKLKNQMDNVRDFIQAVQRAMSVLGL